MDTALTPVAGDDDEEKLSLFSETIGGMNAVNHARKIARLTKTV